MTHPDDSLAPQMAESEQKESMREFLSRRYSKEYFLGSSGGFHSVWKELDARYFKPVFGGSNHSYEAQASREAAVAQAELVLSPHAPLDSAGADAASITGSEPGPGSGSGSSGLGAASEEHS